MSELASTIVLLGIDGDSKPHAARFEPHYHAAALRAATLMGLKAVTVGDDPDLQKAASQLPFGKIFATGRGLVPLVKRALYDKLAALLGTDRELRLGGEPGAPSEVATPPVSSDPKQGQPSGLASAPASELPADALKDGWSSIKVGTIVLGKSPNSDEGWYEALVVSVSAEADELTLRFRDYPNEPKLIVKRTAVGLLASR